MFIFMFLNNFDILILKIKQYIKKLF
jgi:hypothetical protein